MKKIITILLFAVSIFVIPHFVFSDDGKLPKVSNEKINFDDKKLINDALADASSTPERKVILTKALKKYPNDVEYRYFLAIISGAEENYSEALNHLKKIDVEKIKKTNKIFYIRIQRFKVDSLIALESFSEADKVFKDLEEFYENNKNDEIENDEKLTSFFIYQYDRLKDFKNVEKLSLKYLEKNPDDLDIRLKYAVAQNRLKKDDEALKNVNYVLKNDPKNIEAGLLYVILQSKKNPDMALKYAEQMAKDHPEDLIIGMTYNMLKEEEAGGRGKVLEQMEQVIKDPSLLKKDSKDTADLISLAHNWVDAENNLETVHKFLVTVVKENPKDAESYYYLSEICRKEKDYDRAEILVEHAYELDKKNPKFIKGMGRGLLNQKKFNEAIKYLTSPEVSNLSEAKVMLGIAYRELNKNEESIKVLREITFENGEEDYVNAQSVLVPIFYSLNKYKEAMGAIDEVCKYGIYDKGMLMSLVKLLELNEDAEYANDAKDKLYEKYLEKIPDDVDIREALENNLNALAQVYMVTGDEVKVEETCRKLCKLDDKNEKYIYNLGTALFHQEKYGEAVEILKKISPNNEEQYADAQGVLSLSYTKLGQKKDARKALEEILKLTQDLCVPEKPKNLIDTTRMFGRTNTVVCQKYFMNDGIRLSIENEDYDIAEKLYLNYLKRNPNDVEILEGLAIQVYCRKEEFNKAEEMLKKAYKMNNKDFDIILKLGGVLVQQDKVKEGIKYLNEIPSDSEYYSNAQDIIKKVTK